MKISIKWVIVILLVLTGIAFYTRPARAADLYTETSFAGESLDAFVLRISRKAVRATDAHGSELCGAINRVNNIYIVTMNSDFRLNDCTFAVGANTVATFHTHLRSGGDWFGLGDYTHTGYLVTRKRVLHQNGRGTERVVK